MKVTYFARINLHLTNTSQKLPLISDMYGAYGRKPSWKKVIISIQMFAGTILWCSSVKSNAIPMCRNYRIVLNSRPGVYFLLEVLDLTLILDWRLIETSVKINKIYSAGLTITLLELCQWQVSDRTS